MTITRSRFSLKAIGLFSAYLLFGSGFLFSQTMAQKKSGIKTNAALKSEIRELTIGDKVPDFEFALVNHSRKKARLFDFAGKYILLDYWATWCTSCLHKFPTLDSLQKKYSNKLQILLVNTTDTRDDENKLTDFFAKRKNRSGERYSLPTIFNDTITSQFFPHRGVPHYVWIDKNGIIQAITESEYVTPKNVESFINGNILNIPVKRDIDYDFTRPLFVNGNGGSNERYIYRSVLTGYLEGLPSSGGTFKDDNGKVIRLLNTNTSILYLYFQAYRELGLSPNNRIILNVADKIKYLINESVEWRQKYAVSYELILPATSFEDAKRVMQEDLKRYFGLNIVKEKRTSKCLVLRKNEIPESILSKEGKAETNIYDNDDPTPKYMHNYPISALIHHLNNYSKIPVFDETGFTKKVNIELPVDPLDIPMLQAALKKYGFDLTEESREIEFFVLSESQN